MTSSAVMHVRRWWPVPMFLAIVLVAQKVFVESRYDVSGHAGEHLSGASVVFPVTSALWLVSTVLVFVGNIRVVDALVRAGMADTPTSRLVEDAVISSAHDLANGAPWLGVLTSLALIGALRWCRQVSGTVAIGAAILSVIFPPWIVPGAGVLVVTIARCIAYHRAARTDQAPPAATTGATIP
jgi:hypothetical protein